MKSGWTPRLRIKDYLETSERTASHVAAEIGVSRQRVDKWVKLDSPFFIFYENIRTMSIIEKVEYIPPSKVIYPRSG